MEVLSSISVAKFSDMAVLFQKRSKDMGHIQSKVIQDFDVLV